MSSENTHEFKAEISELMNIIINAFYSDKDVFLRELISNASDAIHKCSTNTTPSIKIKSENNILTIEDNGIGMDKETQSHIFDPFYTTKRGSGGTGLGMHITYNIVTQKLLGNIQLESEKGSGVNFIISFPKN